MWYDSGEALFTILVYCGKDQKSKCPLARNWEDMIISNLQGNVSYTIIENEKATVMTVSKELS